MNFFEEGHTKTEDLYVTIKRSIARCDALLLNVEEMKKLTQEEADVMKILPTGERM